LDGEAVLLNPNTESYLALGGLRDQFVEGGLEDGGRLRDHLPLRRSGQRNLHIRLQPFEPMKRDTHAVLQQRDHARRGGVIFLGAHTWRRIRREDLPAQIAAQFLGLIHGGRQRGLPDQTHEDARVALRVDLAFHTAGTAVPVMHQGMRDVDAGGTDIRVGLLAPAARRPRLRPSVS
jgi:hypothetical protein